MEKPFKDIPYTLLKCRINMKSADEDPSHNLLILRKYIAHRGWAIHYSTAGQHIDSKNPHFHYHLLVTPPTVIKIYSSENYAFKKYLGDISHNMTLGHSVKLEELKLDEGAEETDANKIEAYERFLRYPLKENRPYDIYCYRVDLPILIQTAVAHYQHIKEQKKKDELKDQQDKLRWNKICNHLDNQQIPNTDSYTRFRNIFSLLIDYSRNENPPVTLKILETKTIGYMKFRKLLTNDELIDIQLYGIKSLKGNTPIPSLTKEEKETLSILKGCSASDQKHILENLPNGEKIKSYLIL